MKLLATLFLTLSLTPFLHAASSQESFTNTGGTLTGSNAGLNLSGSIVTSFQIGGGKISTGDLGSLTLSTGALSSGSLKLGGSFTPGGSFTIVTNGQDGLPNGTLFSGTFNSDKWTLLTLANGTHQYALTGTLSGSLNGVSVDGATVQLSFNTGKGYFQSGLKLSGGAETFEPVPEPSSLALLGSGLVALAGVVRRRLRAV